MNLQAVLFIVGFLIILGLFIRFINVVSKRLSDNIAQDRFDRVERLIIGGIILGVAQTLGAAINPEWQILSGHIAFLLVLLFRPRGLFPRAVD